VVFTMTPVPIQRERMMRSLIKSSFLWQFTGGFMLGALGLLALQPAEAKHDFERHVTSIVQGQR